MVHNKVGRVFSMVIVSILPHAGFGPNDHRKDTLHFTYRWLRPVLFEMVNNRVIEIRNAASNPLMFNHPKLNSS